LKWGKERRRGGFLFILSRNVGSGRRCVGFWLGPLAIDKLRKKKRLTRKASGKYSNKKKPLSPIIKIKSNSQGGLLWAQHEGGLLTVTGELKGRGKGEEFFGFFLTESHKKMSPGGRAARKKKDQPHNQKKKEASHFLGRGPNNKQKNQNKISWGGGRLVHSGNRKGPPQKREKGIPTNWEEGFCLMCSSKKQHKKTHKPKNRKKKKGKAKNKLGWRWETYPNGK